MNLADLDSVKARIDAINVGNSAEIGLLNSASEVSAKTIKRVQGALVQAQADLAKAVQEGTTKASTTATGATNEVSSLAGLIIPPVTLPTAILWLKSMAQGPIAATIKYAADGAQLAAKSAQIAGAAASKAATLSSISSLLAAKTASLSPSELTKLASLPDMSLTSVTSQVAQKKQGYDMKFVKKPSVPSIPAIPTP
jgi:hypothetical protein